MKTEHVDLSLRIRVSAKCYKCISDLLYLNSTSMSTPPPGEKIPSSMFTPTFLAAAKPSLIPVLDNQTIFTCFSCLLTPSWLKGSNHQKKQLGVARWSYSSSTGLFWVHRHTFRDAATEETLINLEEYKLAQKVRKFVFGRLFLSCNSAPYQ